MGNPLLRTAIIQNLVTFPAQIQPFMKRTAGDLPERIVQLYFVRGWSVRNICERYGMSKAMVHKVLAEWRIRAIESGYIQEIDPDCLSALEPEMTGAHATASSAPASNPETPEPAVIHIGPPAAFVPPSGTPIPLSAAGEHKSGANSYARSA